MCIADLDVDDGGIWKEKLCPFYAKKKCKFGQACVNAHGMQELRQFLGNPEAYAAYLAQQQLMEDHVAAAALDPQALQLQLATGNLDAQQLQQLQQLQMLQLQQIQQVQEAAAQAQLQAQQLQQAGITAQQTEGMSSELYAWFLQQQHAQMQTQPLGSGQHGQQARHGQREESPPRKLARREQREESPRKLPPQMTDMGQMY